MSEFKGKIYPDGRSSGEISFSAYDADESFGNPEEFFLCIEGGDISETLDQVKKLKKFLKKNKERRIIFTVS